MIKVYLCGPINGCTDSEANDWRMDAQSYLAGVAECINPMRRDYRGKEDESAQVIVRGDLDDIAECNLVLAVANKPSWGTAMEIRHAYQMARPVIIVCDADRISPWLRYHSTAIVKTVREATEFIKRWK